MTGTSAFNTKGETLSEKNAMKEFKIKQTDLQRGVDEGKLTFQWRSCMGNSYRLYVTSEVAAFARSCSDVMAPVPVLPVALIDLVKSKPENVSMAPLGSLSANTVDGPSNKKAKLL